MEISTRTEQQILVVSIQGRLDAVTAPDFERQMTEAAAGDSRSMVLNLEGLEYISSAGLRSLLALAKILRARDGKLTFVGLTGAVLDVFKISGFGSIFPVCETEAEAIAKAG